MTMWAPRMKSNENKNGRPGLQMTLKPDFEWFLTQDFLRLKKGDTSRFHGGKEEGKDEKEKSPGRCDEDKKENPPPRSAINNVLYDCIIHKTIFQGGILSC